MNLPNPRRLMHRPVVLLPYAEHDGSYEAEKTDCKYISLGWAQYDQDQLSVKILRYTGNRWSRQSEELPLHRCLDAALLIAITVAQVNGENSIEIGAGTLERQDRGKQLPVETDDRRDRDNFRRGLEDPVLLNRLRKLADTLIALRSAGRV